MKIPPSLIFFLAFSLLLHAITYAPAMGWLFDREAPPVENSPPPLQINLVSPPVDSPREVPLPVQAGATRETQAPQAPSTSVKISTPPQPQLVKGPSLSPPTERFYVKAKPRAVSLKASKSTPRPLPPAIAPVEIPLPLPTETPTATPTLSSVIPDHPASPLSGFPNAANRAVREKLGGKYSVELQLLIYPDGHVEGTIQESTGFSPLDEAVLTDLRTWKWDPARVAGRPVVSQKSIRLKLEADSSRTF